MKRLFALLLCIAMMLTLIGCGPAETPDTPAPTAAPTAAPTETPTETATETVTEAPTEVVADTAIVRNDSCAFTVTKMELNEHLGLQIYASCENNTDRAMTFSWSNVSVCGFMYDPMWAEEVPGNQTVETVIGIDTYALEQMGIESIDQITFTLTAQDSEEFMNAPAVNDVFTIYPTGKTEDQVVYPAYVPTAEQIQITDDPITFIISSTDDELADYYTLNVYISNPTERNLLISWEDVTVNGKDVNPFWATSVAAGKQAYSAITFNWADLEAVGIEAVEEISFRLQAFDGDDWEAAPVVDEVFQFSTGSK